MRREASAVVVILVVVFLCVISFSGSLSAEKIKESETKELLEKNVRTDAEADADADADIDADADANADVDVDADADAVADATDTHADADADENKVAVAVAVAVDEALAIPDPCTELGCGEGRECVFDNGIRAHCECIKSCPLETNIRNSVCSSANKTFNSECEFHRQECLCEEDKPKCLDKGILDSHLDYYGPCVQVQVCTKEELKKFPSRMAEWLKSVMESLDIRQELSVHYSELHRRSRRSANPLVVPAIWEFCNVDSSHDRIISRTEFFPLVAPLKALEHCIGDFLDEADADSDGQITLKEWGLALEFAEEEIEDICEKVPES